MTHNIKMTGEQFSHLVNDFSMMAWSSALPTMDTTIMGRPVIESPDGVIIFIACEYCHGREIERTQYGAVCKFCAAPISGEQLAGDVTLAIIIKAISERNARCPA